MTYIWRDNAMDRVKKASGPAATSTPANQWNTHRRPVHQRINILRGDRDDAQTENGRWALSAILRSLVANFPSRQPQTLGSRIPRTGFQRQEAEI